MSPDTCRLPGCENAPGEQDRDDYRTRSFCSVQHDVKYEHVRADAAQAEREAGL